MFFFIVLSTDTLDILESFSKNFLILARFLNNGSCYTTRKTSRANSFDYLVSDDVRACGQGYPEPARNLRRNLDVQEAAFHTSSLNTESVLNRSCYCYIENLQYMIDLLEEQRSVKYN